MNFEVKDLPQKIAPVINLIKKYRMVLLILGLSLIFGFLVMRINDYAQIEPSEEAVAEKLTTVQRPKIDENALKKIQQLEDQNVEIKSLFQQARENPFSE